MKKPLRGQPQAAEAEVHTCASKSPDEGISLDTDRALRAVEASLAVRENTPHGRDQPIEFDWLGVELVTPRGERLFAFAAECMCERAITGMSPVWGLPFRRRLASQPSAAGIS